MTLKKLASAALVAAAAAAFVIGSPATGEAKAVKPTMHALCPFVYLPVCALKGGKRVTYTNSCFAGNDGATVISNHACSVKKAKKHHAKKAMKKPAKKKPMKKSSKKKM